MKRAPAPGLLRRLGKQLRGPDRREPGRVNHVSLGSHCHMAQVLKRTRLRRWSGAFDWIFSSPAMVLDCLGDDFSGLLDRTQYESTPVEERPAPHEWSCRHRLYAERHRIPYVFNHHDPATSEADYRFLAEGVRRLRAALGRRNASNRFYVMTTVPVEDHVLSGLADRLSARDSDNRLIVFEAVSGASTRRASPLPSLRPNLHRTQVETLSASAGVRFGDPADDAFLDGLVRELAVTP